MSEFNPYEAPHAWVEDQAGSTYQLADRGTRLGARILDGLIYGASAMAGIAVILIATVTQGNGPDSAAGLMGGALILAGFLGVFIWELVWLQKYGQSMGKRFMSVKIVRLNGEPASLGRIFWIRMFLPALMGAFPFLGGVFSLTNICFIFRDDQRCIHDLMADTVVVKA